MNNKIAIPLLVISIILGLAGIFLPESVREVIRETKDNTVGGTNPDIMSPYITYGGVMHNSGGQVMAQSTTTICAIQAPSATSTLIWAAVDFSTSSTSIS